MFRADPRIAKLYNGLTAALSIEKNGGKWRNIALCLMGESVYPLILGVILWTLPLMYTVGPALTFVSSLGLLAGGLLCGVILSVVVLAVRIIQVLRSNRFGLCSGMPQPGDGDAVIAQCLTVWLAHYLDELSGQAETLGISAKKSLTFGDLSEQNIDLQMMTTCISLRELFPEYVVDWMVEHQRPASRQESDRPKDDFRRLPEPEDLPVVVAARMSLSFPILLSAIPLYAKDYNQLTSKLERCWFSDGGLCSNFPIHFFDAPLPERPTFGLELGKVQSHDAPRVDFPTDNNPPQYSGTGSKVHAVLFR